MVDVTDNANPSNLDAVTRGILDPGNIVAILQEANRVELTNNSPIATATTTSTPYGFATADQGDDLVACVREMRAALITLGLLKDGTANSD
jgi:hypothetical protein